MASKKNSSGSASRGFAGASTRGMSRKPEVAMVQPHEQAMEPEIQSGKRKKNDSENPFVKKNG